jgi:hypothetical protein
MTSSLNYPDHELKTSCVKGGTHPDYHMICYRTLPGCVITEPVTSSVNCLNVLQSQEKAGTDGEGPQERTH